jgi:hypothetical protein
VTADIRVLAWPRNDEAQPGNDLSINGSASLVRSLHAAGLIDHYTLLIAAVAGLVGAVPGLAVSACSTSARTEAAADASVSAGGLTSNGYGHTDVGFARVGLKRGTVAVREDGFRAAAHNEIRTSACRCAQR